MRYVPLRELGQGGMGKVQLVYDQLSQQRVALKEVILSSDTPVLDSNTRDYSYRKALVQEFQILASLRHPNIISVLDYGLTDDSTPYFTMEYLPDAQTITDVTKGKSLDYKVQLLAQVLRALIYLHRHNIVHRDLKPDNILVVNDTVKVLDFGLAQNKRERIADNEEDDIVGTIAYMAPEILHGQAASNLSDLYSTGIIAYESISEAYPFKYETISELLNHLASTMIDVNALDVDLALSVTVDRLLTHDPSLRYQSARDALASLCNNENYDISEDDLNIINSFLQSADLVGREREMAQLAEAWQISSTQSSSQYWLLAGEAGIGKSRIMEEIRIHVLIRGGEVIRGQSIQEGSTPYQVWRNIARYLTLSGICTDYDLSLLKTLVPDIEVLLDKSITDLPELDAQSTQERLIQGIIDLLKRFDKPLLLMLEDLHWASDASLNLFQRVTEAIKDKALLIIGDYRNEERPEIPELVPNTQQILLKHLTKERITELTQSMLGEIEKIYEEPLVSALHQSSKGNVFLVVEMLQSLAQNFNFSDIGRQTINPDLFAGGISSIIRNRLNQISDDIQDVLKVAALYGRVIDRMILNQVTGDEELVNRALRITDDLGIVEVRDDNYRFAHDRLRSGLIEIIEEQDKVTLHRKIAKAIEATYPDKLHLYASSLYLHWSEVGNDAKEAQYAAMTGQQFIERGTYNEAISYLDRATHLYQTVSINNLDLARIERLLGEAHFGAGRLKEARKHLTQSVKLLDAPLPSQSILGLLAEVGKQTAHRFLPSNWFIKDGNAAEKVLEASRCYERLAHIFFFDNQTVPLLYASLKTLNLAENAEYSAELARAYGTIGNACALIPSYFLATFYEKQSEEVCEIVNDKGADGWRLMITGFLRAAKGDTDLALERYTKAAEVCLEIGHLARWEESLTLKGMVQFAVGQYDEAAQNREDLYKQAIKTHNDQSLGWALLGKTEYAILQGRFDQAQYHLDDAKHVEARMGLTEKVWMYGMQARLYAFTDHPDTVQSAEAALGLMKQLSTPNAYYSQEGYTGIIEALLTYLEKESVSASEKASIQSMANQAISSVRTFARTFPLARAHTRRIDAWKAYLDGNVDKATKLWTQALEEADVFGKRYEKALVYFDLGRYDLTDGTTPQGNLQKAQAIFEEIGATYYIERCRSYTTVSA